MGLEHRGKRTAFGLLGALAFMALAVWSMARQPPPGGEGGRGPLSARGLYAQAAQESGRQARDRAGVERHLRMALAVITGERATVDDARMELRVRTSLGLVLRAKGRLDEARAVAAPACSMGADGAPPEELVSAGLCER